MFKPTFLVLMFFSLPVWGQSVQFYSADGKLLPDLCVDVPGFRMFASGTVHTRLEYRRGPKLLRSHDYAPEISREWRSIAELAKILRDRWGIQEIIFKDLRLSLLSEGGFWTLVVVSSQLKIINAHLVDHFGDFPAGKYRIQGVSKVELVRSGKTRMAYKSGNVFRVEMGETVGVIKNIGDFYSEKELGFRGTNSATVSEALQLEEIPAFEPEPTTETHKH